MSLLRFSKLSSLGLVGVIFYSIIAAIAIYSADIFLIQPMLELSLSKSDLLFLEGLVLVLFGSYVLFTGERRSASVGLKQRVIYGAPPAAGMRTVFPRDVVRIALSIIIAGLVLITLSLLGI